MAPREHLPVLAVLFAIATLSGMDALIKALSADYATWQIVFLRYLFGFFSALPFALPYLRNGLPPGSLRANLLRGVVIVFTAASFFFALGELPIAEVVMIAFTAPVWTAIIARLMLGERLTRRSLAAIALGFFGVAYVTFPRLSSLSSISGDIPGVAAAIAASIGYALFVVLLRRQSASDPAPVLVFLQTITAVAITAPLGLLQWTSPDNIDLFTFVVVGFTGTIGHLALSWAFARAPAAHLAPFEYTTLLWAAFFGYAFFDEIPSTRFYVGGIFIVGACLLIAARPRTARVVQNKLAE